MALPTTLNTNEVKDSSGTEIEFLRLSSVDRKLVFAKSGETPSLPHRLTISHLETGVGLKLRRRSLVRVDKTSLSTVDAVTPVTFSAYIVLDAPVGAVATMAEGAQVLANLASFCSTLGSTTVLYDGTGNGSAALLAGSL